MSTRVTQTCSKAQCEAIAAWPVVSRMAKVARQMAKTDKWLKRKAAIREARERKFREYVAHRKAIEAQVLAEWNARKAAK